MLFRISLLALAVLMAGCGGDGDEVAPPSASTVAPFPTTTTTTTTTVVADSAADTTTTVAEPPELTFSDPPTETELFALADAYWTALGEAQRTADSDHPGLNQHVTDPLLTRLVEGLDEWRDLGQVAKPPTGERTHRLIEISTDIALVESCFVDDGVVYVEATGAVVNDVVATAARQLEVVRSGERWVVRDQTLRARVEGAASCDGF